MADLDRYMIPVACAGGCGAVEKVVEPPPSRPLLRATAAIVESVRLAGKGWEWWQGKWWCRGCRVRRRMVKAVR